MRQTQTTKTNAGPPTRPTISPPPAAPPRPTPGPRSAELATGPRIRGERHGRRAELPTRASATRNAHAASGAKGGRERAKPREVLGQLFNCWGRIPQVVDCRGRWTCGSIPWAQRAQYGRGVFFGTSTSNKGEKRGSHCTEIPMNHSSRAFHPSRGSGLTSTSVSVTHVWLFTPLQINTESKRGRFLQQ